MTFLKSTPAASFFVNSLRPAQSRLCPFPLLLLISFVALLTGCSKSLQSDSSGVKTSIESALLNEQRGRVTAEEAAVPRSSKSYYNFIRGELALYENNLKEALSFFEAAAALESKPAPTLRKRLAQLYFKNGEPIKSLEQLNYAISGGAEDIELLSLRAAILASQKNLQEAVAAYRDLINKTPTNQDYYILLSSFLAQEGNVEGAIGVLKELLQKVPDSLFGFYYLGRMYETSGNIKEAEKYYKEAVKLNPDSEAIQTDFARTMALQGREGEAIVVCEKLVAANPRNIPARILLAQLYWEEKRHQEALGQFDELKKIEEDSSDTRLKIALIRLEIKDYAGAISELNELLLISASNAQARYFLASALAGMEKREDAISELAKIGESDKMFLEARTLSAYLYRQNKQFDEALTQIDRALVKREKDLNLLGYKSAVEHEAKFYQRAIETTKRIVEIEPTVSRHQFALGVLYEEQGVREDALVSMRKAIELDPNNANALNFLGYSLVEAGSSLKEAEELIKRALKIEPNNGFYLDSLGWAYFKAGRFKDALIQLEKANKIVTDDAVITEHLAEVQLQLGRKSEALATFQKALSFAPKSDDEKAESRIRARIAELTQKQP